MTENFSGQPGVVSGTWAGAGQASSPDLLAEYRLPSQYRRPFLSRFIVAGVFTGLFAFAAAEGANPGVLAVASLVGIGAVYNGAMYIWRGRFRTRVTTQGIEIHGYFNHFVPWDDVKAVREEGYGDSQPLDAGYDVRSGWSGLGSRSSPYRRGGGAMGSTTGRRARLGVIRIFRRHGKSMMLRAPLVTAWAPDPQFSDKLSQMQALSTQYGTRPIGS
jgi:hypothetical protein